MNNHILKKFNKVLIVELIAGLFILLFVYTAISKISSISEFKAVISKSPIISSYAALVAWVIPITEIILSLILFFPKTRKLGLLLSLILMIIFTGYIGYMIKFTPHLPCSCGGVINYLSWNQHLIFNLSFTVLALLGLFFSKNKSNYQNDHKKMTYKLSS